MHDFYARDEHKRSAAQHHAELDLKVTLLIEQKTAKLIDLMEGLRRDLPNVQDRRDPVAVKPQQAMSPEGVLAALDEEAVSTEGSLSISTSPLKAKPDADEVRR